MNRRRIFPWFDDRVRQAHVSSPCASRSLKRIAHASRQCALHQMGDARRPEAQAS